MDFLFLYGTVMMVSFPVAVAILVAFWLLKKLVCFVWDLVEDLVHLRKTYPDTWREKFWWDVNNHMI